ncbi:MAG: replication protein [Leptospiraceae bacterium]|nr:replication protein [Leptospiraceae bacterium]MDW8307697.1 replication protein [Leptospiraceae bacterium]
MQRPLINPRLVPNVTQVPNVIFDHWMRQLSCAEFKVLLALARKTFGWGQEAEFISNSQFVTLTGLTDTGVQKALKSLAMKGLVVKVKQGGGRTANYWAIHLPVTIRTYPSGRRYVLNSSAIPNLVFDEMMAKVSPAEFKVLMLIARKTYGFHKEIDAIARSQFEEITGLSPAGVKKALKSLSQGGFIVKVREGGGRTIAQWAIDLTYPHGRGDANSVTPFFSAIAASGTTKNEHLVAPNSVTPKHQPRNPQTQSYEPSDHKQKTLQNLYIQQNKLTKPRSYKNPFPEELHTYLEFLEIRYFDDGVYYFTCRAALSAEEKKFLARHFESFGIKVKIF